MESNSLSPYVDNAELVAEVVKQITKDFGSFQLKIAFSGITQNAYDELHSQISIYLDELIKVDPGKCTSLLYRIDIPEEHTARALEEPSFADFIANLIIQRELQKVLIRNHYGKRE